MNLRELWVDTKKELDSSNISDSDIESEVIIRKVLGLDRNNFFATLDKNWHFFGLFSYKSILIEDFISLSNIDKTIPGNPAPEPKSAQILLFLSMKSMT